MIQFKLIIHFINKFSHIVMQRAIKSCIQLIEQ